jgi:hypothetical protein
MYDTLENNELNSEKFQLKSKIIGVNVLFHQEFVDHSQYETLADRINVEIKDLFENDLPSFVAMTSNSPDVLDEINSDAVKSSITAINGKLDQQFGTSTDTFLERQDVLQRVAHIFQRGLIKESSHLDKYHPDNLRDVLNHPDEPNMGSGVLRRPFMNGEIKKYEFSSRSARDLLEATLSLRNNIQGGFKDANFLFRADIEEDITMREQSTRNGTVYPRSVPPMVELETQQLTQQVSLINAELAARQPSPTPMIVEDRVSNGIGPAVIGYDDRDRDNSRMRG